MQMSESQTAKWAHDDSLDTSRSSSSVNSLGLASISRSIPVSSNARICFPLATRLQYLPYGLVVQAFPIRHGIGEVCVAGAMVGSRNHPVYSTGSNGVSGSSSPVIR